jgi:hypothetical protein
MVDFEARCNLIKVNNARIYQAMIERDFGVRETCLRSRVNHKTLEKMLAGLMVRVDAVRRLGQALAIPISELLIVSHDAPPFRKSDGDGSVSPSAHF